MIGSTALRRTIASDEVELWWVRLTGEYSAEDRRVLSAGEFVRSTRFDTAEFAADFIRTRAALRRVLSTYTGSLPEELAFTTGRHGKPELADSTTAFNLTHTHGLAVVAVAGSGSIGVDVESVDTDFDLDGLAPRVLTAREAASVGTDRRRFLHHWVAKESYLKWLGSGLTVSPDAIELRADQHGRAVIAAVDGDLPTAYVQHFGLNSWHAGAFVGDHPEPRFTLRPAESVCVAANLRRRISGVQA
ncbi:4'-phosphopantetheinyl transferase family protein [Nocardia suismassiliense]|uniref:4'-phosphopantetheinyl transferase family protein n=1 Tax=Nocardia suismassiliense TaxID=2077092 RepID=A0ABW6QWL4_9NOCA